jgi:hypothetical protein
MVSFKEQCLKGCGSVVIAQDPGFDPQDFPKKAKDVYLTVRHTQVFKLRQTGQRKKSSTFMVL